MSQTPTDAQMNMVLTQLLLAIQAIATAIQVADANQATRAAAQLAATQNTNTALGTTLNVHIL